MTPPHPSIDRWTISRYSFSPFKFTVLYVQHSKIGAYNQRRTCLGCLAAHSFISDPSNNIKKWTNSFTFYFLCISSVPAKWKNMDLVPVVPLGLDLRVARNWIVCRVNSWSSWTCPIKLMIMWLQIMSLFQDVGVAADFKGKTSVHKQPKRLIFLRVKRAIFYFCVKKHTKFLNFDYIRIKKKVLRNRKIFANTLLDFFKPWKYLLAFL